MNADRLFDALAIPPEARVDRRVPKKLLAEQGAPTATDRRHIQEGIDEFRWLAALKPSSIGVPEYRDEVRDYREIAVLGVTLRPQARTLRLIELIHRAIPYPVLLITTQNEGASLSQAHQRFSQSEAGATVVDGAAIVSPTLENGFDGPENLFLECLPLARQSRVHLCALYQGWIECVEALQAAQVTGRFVLTPTPQAGADRRAALAEHDRLQKEIAGLRARAEKETQIRRRVDLNLEIRRLTGEIDRALLNL